MVWSFACSRVVPGTLATTKGLTGFLFFEIRWEGILADARARPPVSEEERTARGRSGGRPLAAYVLRNCRATAVVDSSGGARFSCGTAMDWRGRTVEYSPPSPIQDSGATIDVRFKPRLAAADSDCRSADHRP